MKPIYARLAKMADRLMVTFADEATVSLITRGYSAATDSTTTTRESQSCLAVINPRTVRGEGGREVTQTVATLNVRPNQGDELTVGEVTYKVVEVEEVSPIGAASYRPDLAYDGNFQFDDGSVKWASSPGSTAPAGTFYDAFEGRTNVWTHDRYAQGYGILIPVNFTSRYRLKASFYCTDAAMMVRFGAAFYTSVGAYVTERYSVVNGTGHSTGWKTLQADVQGSGTGTLQIPATAAFMRPLWVLGNASTTHPRWGIDSYAVSNVTTGNDIPAIIYRAVVQG